jgi:hypothetical protein
MLVYGDHREFVDPAERLGSLSEELAQVARMPPGIRRHGKLVGALVSAGQLLQGIADAGCPEEELSALVCALAAAALRSWYSGFAETGALPSVRIVELPGEVEVRLPEGFAFYAVYPEAYAGAARRLRLAGPPRVIAIRSIGTTLGAVVAVTLGAPPPLTVRPFGDPFARQVELPSRFLERDAHYVLVDEGPGLSGSSFGAVADALEAAGVPSERIAFLPSHSGDLGPQASEPHRQRWHRAQRVAAEFDPRWLSELLGPLERFSTERAGERLKYLGTRAGERVLAKFAGIGAIGERKLKMARALHGAGLTPEPLDFVHGFLVERWCEGTALANDEKPVEEIGRYIGTRAQLFPAREDAGATVEELLTMCRRNLALAFGKDVARAVDRWHAAAVSQGLKRVWTDNKIDREEWLRLPNGRLLKTDAVDHHCGHDLIGCQDMAWDVAGAIVEFDLGADDTRRLIAHTERAAARPVNPALLEFCLVAYCCFRLGQARLSGRPTAAGRYETAVIELLRENYCCSKRQESLVD